VGRKFGFVLYGRQAHGRTAGEAGQARKLAGAPARSGPRGKFLPPAPLAAAGVLLRSRADTTQAFGTTRDTNGAFEIARVPFGTYVLECSLVGHAAP